MRASFIQRRKEALEKLGTMAKDVGAALQKDEMPPLLDRPDLKPRAFAFMLDVFLASFAVFLSFVLGRLVAGYTVGNILMMSGGIVATGYMLARDGIKNSRSLGKHLVGLKVVDEGGHHIGIALSVRRNAVPAAPFGFFIVYGALNLFADLLGSLGWLLSGAVLFLAVGAVLREGYSLLLDREASRRAGDVRAGTRVVELEE